MPTIELPREATGQEVTVALRTVGKEIRFNYFDFRGEVALSRKFREHTPPHLRFAFDTTPHLEFRFGKIDLEKNYESLDCEVRLGAHHVYPIDINEHEQYKPFYDKFVQGLNTILELVE